VDRWQALGIAALDQTTDTWNHVTERERSRMHDLLSINRKGEELW
jgi:hypothetical protein